MQRAREDGEGCRSAARIVADALDDDGGGCAALLRRVGVVAVRYGVVGLLPEGERHVVVGDGEGRGQRLARVRLVCDGGDELIFERARRDGEGYLRPALIVADARDDDGRLRAALLRRVGIVFVGDGKVVLRADDERHAVVGDDGYGGELAARVGERVDGGDGHVLRGNIFGTDGEGNLRIARIVADAREGDGRRACGGVVCVADGKVLPLADFERHLVVLDDGYGGEFAARVGERGELADDHAFRSDIFRQDGEGSRSAALIIAAALDDDGGEKSALLRRVDVVAVRYGVVCAESERIAVVGDCQRGGQLPARVRLSLDGGDEAVFERALADRKGQGALARVVSDALERDGGVARGGVVCIRDGIVPSHLEIVGKVGRLDVRIEELDRAARVGKGADDGRRDGFFCIRSDALGEDMEGQARFARIVADARDGEGDARFGDVGAVTLVFDRVISAEREVVFQVARGDVGIGELHGEAGVGDVLHLEGDVFILHALARDGKGQGAFARVVADALDGDGGLRAALLRRVLVVAVFCGVVGVLPRDEGLIVVGRGEGRGERLARVQQLADLCKGDVAVGDIFGEDGKGQLDLALVVADALDGDGDRRARHVGVVDARDGVADRVVGTQHEYVFDLPCNIERRDVAVLQLDGAARVRLIGGGKGYAAADILFFDSEGNVDAALIVADARDGDRRRAGGGIGAVLDGKILPLADFERPRIVGDDGHGGEFAARVGERGDGSDGYVALLDIFGQNGKGHLRAALIVADARDGDGRRAGGDVFIVADGKVLPLARFERHLAVLDDGHGGEFAARVGEGSELADGHIFRGDIFGQDGEGRRRGALIVARPRNGDRRRRAALLRGGRIVAVLDGVICAEAERHAVVGDGRRWLDLFARVRLGGDGGNELIFERARQDGKVHMDAAGEVALARDGDVRLRYALARRLHVVVVDDGIVLVEDEPPVAGGEPRSVVHDAERRGERLARVRHLLDRRFEARARLDRERARGDGKGQGDAARVVGVCGGNGDGGLLAALLHRVRVVCVARDDKVGVEREGVGEIGRRNIIVIQRDGAARVRLLRDRKLDVAARDVFCEDTEGQLDLAPIVALPRDGDGDRRARHVGVIDALGLVRDDVIGTQHEVVDLLPGGVGRRDVAVFQLDGAARVGDVLRLKGNVAVRDIFAKDGKVRAVPCGDVRRHAEETERLRRSPGEVALAFQLEVDGRARHVHRVDRGGHTKIIDVEICAGDQRNVLPVQADGKGGNGIFARVDGIIPLIKADRIDVDGRDGKGQRARALVVALARDGDGRIARVFVVCVPRDGKVGIERKALIVVLQREVVAAERDRRTRVGEGADDGSRNGIFCIRSDTLGSDGEVHIDAALIIAAPRDGDGDRRARHVGVVDALRVSDDVIGTQHEVVCEVRRRDVGIRQLDGAARVRLIGDRKLDVCVADILFFDGKLVDARALVVARAFDVGLRRARVFVVCVYRDGKVGAEHEVVDLLPADIVGRRNIIAIQRDRAARVRLFLDRENDVVAADIHFLDGDRHAVRRRRSVVGAVLAREVGRHGHGAGVGIGIDGEQFIIGDRSGGPALRAARPNVRGGHVARRGREGRRRRQRAILPIGEREVLPCVQSGSVELPAGVEGDVARRRVACAADADGGVRLVPRGAALRVPAGQGIAGEGDRGQGAALPRNDVHGGAIQPRRARGRGQGDDVLLFDGDLDGIGCEVRLRRREAHLVRFRRRKAGDARRGEGRVCNFALRAVFERARGDARTCRQGDAALLHMPVLADDGGDGERVLCGRSRLRARGKDGRERDVLCGRFPRPSVRPSIGIEDKAEFGRVFDIVVLRREGDGDGQILPRVKADGLRVRLRRPLADLHLRFCAGPRREIDGEQRLRVVGLHRDDQRLRRIQRLQSGGRHGQRGARGVERIRLQRPALDGALRPARAPARCGLGVHENIFCRNGIVVLHVQRKDVVCPRGGGFAARVGEVLALDAYGKLRAFGQRLPLSCGECRKADERRRPAEGEAKKGRRAQRAQRPKTFFIFYRRMFHVRISVLCLFVRYHCTTRGAIRQYARARF